MSWLSETLKKPFFKQDTDISNLSTIDATKVEDMLGSDLDMSQLFTPNMVSYDRKTKDLTNAQWIKLYRNLASSAEASVIIDEIINEFYSGVNENNPEITVDKYEIPPSLNKKIEEAFLKIVNLVDFRRNGQGLFRHWYVDAHLFLECIYDETKMKEGIKHIARLDPLGMTKQFDEKTRKHKYKYVNGTAGFFGKDSASFLYDPEQIVYINSDLKNEEGKIISYIHPALKIYNQMQTIEDMLVVYRITRGSEKRAIKVNVGNMPKAKAVTYMSELVNKFRYKKSYNSQTGTVENNSHIVAVTEDIWLPTKNSTKDIEIDTLQGGMQLGELDDLNYFRNKLLFTLRVPSNRFSEDGGSFDITATEINRQEMRFMKFIAGLRLKFNEMFIELLRRELLATGAMNDDEFYKLRPHIIIKYPGEGAFLKKEFNSLFKSRLDLLEQAEQYIGKYVSAEWVKKVILEQTDEEIADMKQQMEKEELDGASKQPFGSSSEID
jgi:hypothetical protein